MKYTDEERKELLALIKRGAEEWDKIPVDQEHVPENEYDALETTCRLCVWAAHRRNVAAPYWAVDSICNFCPVKNLTGGTCCEIPAPQDRVLGLCFLHTIISKGDEDLSIEEQVRGVF